MRISGIETVRIDEHANLLWLLVHTDEGVTGLGETFFLPGTVEAYVHEHLAPRVLGEDPLDVNRLVRSLDNYLGFPLHRRRDARQLRVRHRAVGPLRKGRGPAAGAAARRLLAPGRYAPTTRAPAPAT